MPNGAEGVAFDYDELVVAGGSAYSYFGHDDWAANAPELKSLSGALGLRSRILSAFEAAEVERDESERSAWLTFVVVGAGPTGVEMAGQIGELARDVLHRDFRNVDTRTAKVLLVEAGPRVLSTFPESLSRRAERSLARLGVTVLLDTTVVGVGERHVELRHATERPRPCPPAPRSGRRASRRPRWPQSWPRHRERTSTAPAGSSSSPI